MQILSMPPIANAKNAGIADGCELHDPVVANVIDITMQHPCCLNC
jgi:hypothetical protein